MICHVNSIPHESLVFSCYTCTCTCTHKPLDVRVYQENKSDKWDIKFKWNTYTTRFLYDFWMAVFSMGWYKLYIHVLCTGYNAHHSQLSTIKRYNIIQTRNKEAKYNHRTSTIWRYFHVHCIPTIIVSCKFQGLYMEWAYKRQGHATFEGLCWLFLCAMVESQNNDDNSRHHGEIV